MSCVARQTWIADKLREYGLDVVEEDGWQTRGSSWFFPKGVVGHHTASRTGSDAPSLRVVLNGRTDLAGPLCHVLISRSGRCHIIAAGRANHAGTGGYNGLTGNRSVLGIEVENNGVGEPWSPHLVAVFDRASAALLDGLDTTADYYCGHKEWAPRRKIDPHGLDMNEQRARIANILKGGSPIVTDPTREQWRALQQALTDIGANPGTPDGIPGPLTRGGLATAYILAGGSDLIADIAERDAKIDQQQSFIASLVDGVRSLATEAAALADRTFQS